MIPTPVIRYTGLLALVAAGLLAAPAASYAQLEDPEPRKVAFYRYVEPGQTTMRVSVWGDVTAPGRYEIRAGTDLLEMLSLAGGPGERLERNNEKHRTSVVLSRKSSAAWSIIFEAPLDDLTTGRSSYPALQDEDLLKIETVVSQPFDWRDGLTIIGALATVALLIERITRISN